VLHDLKKIVIGGLTYFSGEVHAKNKLCKV